MRTDHDNRFAAPCKGRNGPEAENFHLEAPLPVPDVGPDPAEKTRKLARLRATLAGSAPWFEAQLALLRQGGRP